MQWERSASGDIPVSLEGRCRGQDHPSKKGKHPLSPREERKKGEDEADGCGRDWEERDSSAQRRPCPVRRGGGVTCEARTGGFPKDIRSDLPSWPHSEPPECAVWDQQNLAQPTRRPSRTESHDRFLAGARPRL